MMNREKILKYYTYKLDMIVLNVLAFVLFILIGGLVFLIERHNNYIITMPLSIFFILMFLWLIIHEILHGIGFILFKEVKRKNITFGMFLEKSIFYCMCKQKIGRHVILTSLLFPITVIGFITLIIGMVFNQYELVFLSILNIVSSIGDIVMTIYFLKCPKDIIYLDLDDCTSFTVLSSKELDNIKVLGICLDEKGFYNENKLVSLDKRRIVISKGSYLVLFIMILLIVFNIIIGL